MSLFRIIVEGDCLSVIQALRRSGRCPLLYGHIVDETKRLGSVLRSCEFQHLRVIMMQTNKSIDLIFCKLDVPADFSASVL